MFLYKQNKIMTGLKYKPIEKVKMTKLTSEIIYILRSLDHSLQLVLNLITELTNLT